MFSALVLGVLLLPPLAPLADTKADPDADPAKADLQKLQGSWRATSHEVGGKKSEAKAIAGWKLTVKNDTMETRDGDDLMDASTFTLNPSLKVKTVDLKLTAGPDKGKLVRGIYRLADDTLTVCVAEPGQERPKEFATKEGSGLMLFVFQRAKK